MQCYDESYTLANISSITVCGEYDLTFLLYIASRDGNFLYLAVGCHQAKTLGDNAVARVRIEVRLVCM